MKISNFSFIKLIVLFFISINLFANDVECRGKIYEKNGQIKCCSHIVNIKAQETIFAFWDVEKNICIQQLMDPILDQKYCLNNDNPFFKTYDTYFEIDCTKRKDLNNIRTQTLEDK